MRQLIRQINGRAGNLVPVRVQSIECMRNTASHAVLTQLKPRQDSYVAEETASVIEHAEIFCPRNRLTTTAYHIKLLRHNEVPKGPLAFRPGMLCQPTRGRFFPSHNGWHTRQKRGPRTPLKEPMEPKPPLYRVLRGLLRHNIRGMSPLRLFKTPDVNRMQDHAASRSVLH